MKSKGRAPRGRTNDKQGRKQPAAACFRPLSIREEGTLHPVGLVAALSSGAAWFFILGAL
ncbi:hypothetical protein X768_04775 [Mesorhizobium sp. LSJC265A00]|nr:hypothetical protein X768_04775 [Mesorhizobium sp. LSJC265A00]